MGYLSTTKDKLHKFFSLSLKNMIKIVVYSVLFHLFLIAFRVFGYKKSKRIIDRLFIPNKSVVDTSGNFLINEAEIISYSTFNTPVKSTCLERSLFTYAILGIYGVKCDLKIGINNSAQDFSAHAWIELNNRPLNDNIKNLESFSTF